VLSFRQRKDEWDIKVIKTIASTGTGVNELLETIKEHKNFLEKTGEFEKRRKEKLKQRIREIIEEKLRENFWTSDREKLLEERVNSIVNSRLNPFEIAEELIEHFYHQNSL
jgi:LAO/AO transport system kinase